MLLPLLSFLDAHSRQVWFIRHVRNISAVPGLPAVVIPAGMNAAGLRLAIELLGRAFSEAKLLEIARAYPATRSPRVIPRTTPPLPGDGLAF
jgi:amidase